jgi:hypothetical protein
LRTYPDHGLNARKAQPTLSPRKGRESETTMIGLVTQYASALITSLPWVLESAM